ncbi:MAG: M14 family metallopeptidase [Flavitalea sp.]
MRFLVTVLMLAASLSVSAQQITTRYEISKTLETPTYPEIIQWWKNLAARYPQVSMRTMGPTDAGFPLHLIILDNEKDFNFESLRRKNRRIILVNNGIHPGEPDGIDASMLLVRDIVTGKKKLPANVTLALIPVYNIGGCLNRSANYRVDQNGPAEFGFRGNSQNLDLNRDFIKSDSREARSFAEIFHLCDPDVFVDNHVSNGADYQHVMTLLSSQHSKLGGVMGEFMNKSFEPGMYKLMKQKGYDLVPYVSFQGTPENGMVAYFDGPRYSTGYAALWHTFAFMPETHMLKSYKQRVESTYSLMESFIEFTSKNSSTIKQLRDQTKLSVKTQAKFGLGWALDRSVVDSVMFKGFESTRKASDISGAPRLFYDRTRPYEKSLKYYNHFSEKASATKPAAYVIPQGWWKVTDLLKLNGIKMTPLAKDTTIEVEAYRIESFQAGARPYEMHHQNGDVKISTMLKKVNFRKGDLIVPMNQVGNRFLMETLEPQADDSYFVWNFFDGILGQKEGYSGYAFEDIAFEYLKQNPELKQKLEERRSSDSAFAKNGAAQLDFIYRNSPFYEPAHMQYPVYRIIK